MVEFVGGEPISVGVDEPITFENKTDTAFDVGCGIVFRKSGLYLVSVAGKHMSVTVEPEQKKGKWTNQKGGGCCCSECGRYALDEVDGNFIHVAFKSNFCPNCGADMRGEQDG